MDIIISAITHRTGSTLLQRICNVRPKTLIWGEHQGIVTQFANIYKKTKYCSDYCQNERLNYFGNMENPNQWIANLNPTKEFVEKAITASIKSFLSNYYSQYKDSHDIIGFKEVRYGENELKLLRKCYKNAIILLLVRNPIETWRSIPNDWPKHNHIKQYTDDWNKNAKFYLEMSKKDEKTYLIRFEDIIQRNEQTIKLILELTKISQTNFNNVLNHKIGGTINKTITDENKYFITNNCQQTMKLLNY